MTILKKLLFPIFSLFLAFRSIDLIRNLISSDPNGYTIVEQIIISFLMNLFITGIFAFTGFAYSTSGILPKGYYKIKNAKQLKTTYRSLGINHFRIILLFLFWGRKSNRKKYFNGTKSGLKNFVYQTKQSEFGHLASFVTILFSSAYLLFFDYYLLVLFINLINIIGNLFPIILQRFHRMRIDPLTQKY